MESARQCRNVRPTLFRASYPEQTSKQVATQFMKLEIVVFVDVICSDIYCLYIYNLAVRIIYILGVRCLSFLLQFTILSV